MFDLAQAVITNGFVYVSGQIPLDPETRKIVSEDIREQTVNFQIYVAIFFLCF